MSASTRGIREGSFTTLSLAFAFAHFEAEWAVELQGMMRRRRRVVSLTRAGPLTLERQTRPLATFFGITDISAQNMGTRILDPLGPPKPNSKESWIF